MIDRASQTCQIQQTNKQTNDQTNKLWDVGLGTLHGCCVFSVTPSGTSRLRSQRLWCYEPDLSSLVHSKNPRAKMATDTFMSVLFGMSRHGLIRDAELNYTDTFMSVPFAVHAFGNKWKHSPSLSYPLLRPAWLLKKLPMFGAELYAQAKRSIPSGCNRFWERLATK